MGPNLIRPQHMRHLRGAGCQTQPKWPVQDFQSFKQRGQVLTSVKRVSLLDSMRFSEMSGKPERNQPETQNSASRVVEIDWDIRSPFLQSPTVRFEEGSQSGHTRISASQTYTIQNLRWNCQPVNWTTCGSGKKLKLSVHPR